MRRVTLAKNYIRQVIFIEEVFIGLCCIYALLFIYVLLWWVCQWVCLQLDSQFLDKIFKHCGFNSTIPRANYQDGIGGCPLYRSRTNYQSLLLVTSVLDLPMRTNKLDRCYAYGRPYAQKTHRCYAYGQHNLTLTRPYANFSSLLYFMQSIYIASEVCFMAVALNHSFCFSTVHESNVAKTQCDVSKYSAASFSKSCPFAHFLSKQEAQLLQRDRAMLCVIEYFAQSLQVI